MIDRIHWLGHGSFLIEGPPLIYINPWQVARSVFHADVILISHDHYHHCSLADVNKVRGPNTRIIGSERVAHEIEDCMVLRPWQSVTVDRACIKAVPAHSPERWNHPTYEGGLGFVISLNFYDIYYAGDTQVIPEMADLRPDIAILPINGDGTMTVDDATIVVKQMRPRWVIPSNWGSEGATRLDAETLKKQVDTWSDVVILPQRK